MSSKSHIERYGAPGRGRGTAPERTRDTQAAPAVRPHGLLANIPRSRRWRVTARGATVISAAIHYRERALAEEMLEQAS